MATGGPITPPLPGNGRRSLLEQYQLQWLHETWMWGCGMPLVTTGAQPTPRSRKSLTRPTATQLQSEGWHGA
jgi:hypothetical protein